MTLPEKVPPNSQKPTSGGEGKPGADSGAMVAQRAPSPVSGVKPAGSIVKPASAPAAAKPSTASSSASAAAKPSAASSAAPRPPVRPAPGAQAASTPAPAQALNSASKPPAKAASKFPSAMAALGEDDIDTALDVALAGPSGLPKAESVAPPATSTPSGVHLAPLKPLLAIPPPAKLPSASPPRASPPAASPPAASSGPASVRAQTPSSLASAQQFQMSEAIRRLSDPELQATAEALSRAMPRMIDPEASLDIPPPTEVEPPEDRPPDAKDPYIGTTFDHRYKIERLLGEGGMGFVYLARHKVIDKKVAVKVLRNDLARDREILERFLQEAKAASSIGNPHIVDISDFGDLPDGSTYFVMEHLEGESLSQLIDSGQRILPDKIYHIALQIADGLAAAHDRGIVHRDLKPDNVYVVPRSGDPYFVKILDFGIAKVSTNADTKLTKAGAVFGTPHYMSPEQAAGAPVDHRTDIYALGVMLYELASGQLPFTADNFMGILTQHMYKAPVPPRMLIPAPECPPALEAVILKCLSKKAEARYQSMGELAEDVTRAKEGVQPLAVAELMARSGGFNVPADYWKTPNAIVPATPPEPKKKWPRLVWVAGAAAAVAIVTMIFVMSSIVNSGQQARQLASATAVAPPTATATPLPPPTASQVVVAPPPAGPKKVTVTLGAVPANATAYRDEMPFPLPASFEVEEGKTVSVELRADGFESMLVTLDGKELRKVVELKKGKKSTGAGPAGAGTVDPSAPHNGIVDPWGGTRPKRH